MVGSFLYRNRSMSRFNSNRHFELFLLFPSFSWPPLPFEVTPMNPALFSTPCHLLSYSAQLSTPSSWSPPSSFSSLYPHPWPPSASSTSPNITFLPTCIYREFAPLDPLSHFFAGHNVKYVAFLCWRGFLSICMVIHVQITIIHAMGIYTLLLSQTFLLLYSRVHKPS